MRISSHPNAWRTWVRTKHLRPTLSSDMASKIMLIIMMVWLWPLSSITAALPTTQWAWYSHVYLGLKHDIDGKRKRKHGRVDCYISKKIAMRLANPWFSKNAPGLDFKYIPWMEGSTLRHSIWRQGTSAGGCPPSYLGRKKCGVAFHRSSHVVIIIPRKYTWKIIICLTTLTAITAATINYSLQRLLIVISAAWRAVWVVLRALSRAVLSSWDNRCPWQHCAGFWEWVDQNIQILNDLE